MSMAKHSHRCQWSVKSPSLPFLGSAKGLWLSAETGGGGVPDPGHQGEL